MADLATHTVTLVLEEPVSSFTETTDYLFYISQDNQIIRTDYAGETHDIIYTAQYGDLSSIEYYNNHLYFLDADYAVDFALSTNDTAIMIELEDAASIVPNGEGTFYIRNDAAEIFDFDVKTQKMARVIDEDLCASAISPLANWDGLQNSEEQDEIRAALPTGPYYSLPLPEYPAVLISPTMAPPVSTTITAVDMPVRTNVMASPGMFTKSTTINWGVLGVLRTNLQVIRVLPKSITALHLTPNCASISLHCPRVHMYE